MVVFLITGPICSGKETLANVLHNNYGYKLHKVQSCSFPELWSLKDCTFKDGFREKVIKECHDKVREALKDWKESHVIYPVLLSETIKEILLKRSYIKIITITAETCKRFSTFLSKYCRNKPITLEEFIEINDKFSFNLGVEECMGKSIIKIINNFDLESLEREVATHVTITEKIFRPDWDHYFMKLAHVVKERSNCMKRSVGAIIVANNRIISTGYNGAPGKLSNCYEGGCERCNSNKPQGTCLDECNCIHAEENSVLECGVHRAKGATIYTTLAPCRWCTKVIIQAGIVRVVYDQRYSHEQSEDLLKKAGIQLDCINIEP